MARKCLMRLFVFLSIISSFAVVHASELTFKDFFVQSDALESRFNKVITDALKTKDDLNKSFKGFYDSFVNLKKQYEDIEPTITAIGFKPVSKFIGSLFDFAEKLVPISDYLAKIKRMLDAVKILLSKVDVQVEALKKQKDDFDAQRAKFSSEEKSLRGNDLLMSLPVPNQSFLETFNKKLSSIEAQWKDAKKVIASVTKKMDECTVLMSKDLSSYLKMVIAKLDDIKEALGKAGLDKATIVPGLLEITGLEIGEENLVEMQKLKESNIAQFEAFAKRVKALEDLNGLASAIDPFVKDLSSIVGDSSQKFKENINRFKSINPTNIALSGRLFELLSFEDAKIYERIDKGVWCWGQLITLPQLKLPLPFLIFKNLSVFHSNCSRVKTSGFNDSKLVTIFGDVPIKSGNLLQVDVDFSSIRKILNKVPVLNKITSLIPSSVAMSGMIRPASSKFKGTTLDAAIKGSVDIPKLGSLSTESLGIAVVDSKVPGAVSVVIPLKGKVGVDLGGFKPVFDTSLVIDPSSANAVVSGVWKGSWNIFNTGLTIKNLGLSAAIGAAGVTGAGLKGSLNLGGKDLELTTYGDLSSANVAMTGEFKGGLSLRDIVKMQAQLAGVAGGGALSEKEVLSLVPNVSLSECKISIVPKTMMVFGKMQSQGITISGKASLFGKKCNALIWIGKTSLLGSFTVDALNFANLVKISGVDAKKPLEIKFNVESGKTLKSIRSGLYADASVELLAEPFKGIKAQGLVDIAPNRIKISNLTAQLMDFAECELNLEAGLSLSKLPVDWKIKATLKKGARDSFSSSLNDTFGKMKDCFS